MNEPGSAYCYQCGLPLEDKQAAAYESDAAYPASARSYQALRGSTDATTTERAPSAPTHPYGSPRTRANWTVGLLVATCIAYALDMVMTFNLLSLVEQQNAGQFVPRSQLTDASEVVDSMSGLLLVAHIATGVPFLMWTHRVSRNLESLGARGQRFSPGWAVGWWFVPIMNFFRPYQVMAEMWRGSDPDMYGEAVDWRQGPGSALLVWWWLSWVASFFVLRLATPFSNADTVLSTTDLWWNLLAGALSICSGVLAVLVVRRITSRHEARHRRMMTG